MTLNASQIGDKGQRYEIRFLYEGDVGFRVIGWTDSPDAAERLAVSWAGNPSVEKVWVFDRHTVTNGQGDQ